ncbi:hypothetical protein BCR34DRAFT_483441, partial [Clohesyomyces aquaticus]
FFRDTTYPLPSPSPSQPVDLDEYHAHLDHCADMLGQRFMCDADAGLIKYNWLSGHHSPHPNFNTLHRCRDYGRLFHAARRYA